MGNYNELSEELQERITNLDLIEAFSTGKKENYLLIYGAPKVQSVYDNSIYPMMEQIYEKLLGDAKAHNKDSVLYKHHIDYINDIVVDYIASMTDDYFVDLYHHLFPNGKYSVEYIGYFEN